MVVSMTGFASRNITLTFDKDKNVQATVSIKSLNSRFFEVTCKLPHPFAELETDLISLFKQTLKRGHVYCSMHLKSIGDLKSSIEPSLSAVRGYVHAITLIKQETGVEGNLMLSDLLTLPHIFTMEEASLDQTVKEQLMAAFRDLISTLQEARRVEGAHLLEDIRARLVIIEREMKDIARLAETSMTDKKHAISRELEQLQDSDTSASDMRRNLLFVSLDKIDVHEEIVRFQSHLERTVSLLDQKAEEKGKQLDFTLQELGREINTITAKCSNADMSTHAITIKVELEKIREQVQNVV